MKELIYSILLLIIVIEIQAQESTNLSELIKQLHGSKRQLTLGSGVYYLYGSATVRDVEEFTLVGNNKTIVECVENREFPQTSKYKLDFFKVSRIMFEGITFQKCNLHAKLKDPPSQTDGYFFFKNCGSVQVHHCKFLNIKGINLLCYNTLELRVMDSIFQNKYSPSKAMLLFINETEKQSISLEVRRSEFEGEEWMSGYNGQSDTANFAVKCGSAVSAFILTNVNPSIQIVDNKFRENKAAHGGAICVWLSENVVRPNINIERGNFVDGQANTRSEDEKYHERPGGGAIVLFLFAKSTKLLISDCNFTDNLGYRGGAIYLDFSLPPNGSEIINCRFEGNQAKLGGAVMISTDLDPDQVYITFINSSFIGNKADMFGGAILAQRASVNMRDENTIANNTVVYGDGGGMGLVYSHVLVNGSFRVLNNTANRGGGGVYMTSQGKISMGYSGSLLNISENKAKMYGGGIFAYSLNDDYPFMEKILPEIAKFKRSCFLRGEENTTIVMLGNKVENENEACSGNTVYTQLLGKCLTEEIMGEKLIMDEGQCNLDTRENSFKMEIGSITKVTCNASLFDIKLDDVQSGSVNILKYCKIEGEVDPFTKKENNLPVKMINEFHSSHNISQFYYIYPGYATSLNVSSTDYFNNSVVARVNLTAKIYSNGKNHPPKSNHIEFDLYSDTYKTVSFLTNISTSVMLRSKWYGVGVVCVKSISGYPRIKKCIGILMGECPPGFKQERDKCNCVKDSYYHCNTNNQIVVKPGIYMANKYTFNDSRIGMHHSICLWYRCKCYLGATQSNCTFDPMKPDQQCYSGLTGLLCGECSNPNETLMYSPFLSYYLYNNCFDCTWPAFRIAGVIFILILISSAIILFKIDFFEDYLRSIIFYANILYVILVNSNSYINPVVYNTLGAPVLILNLLVTQFLPFCLYPRNNPVLVTIFQMIMPWGVIVLFLGLQKLLWKYDFFSKREIPIQIFSMILLTYTDLSIHAFMVINCPHILNTRYWLFHGKTICFEDWHLRATILSAFVIFILISIPVCLTYFIYWTNIRLFGWITNHFKKSFRFWEIYKLFLRLLISFILLWLPNYANADNLRVIVCLICFISMIINSIFQPAVNRSSNHFESFCFLWLGIIAIPQKNLFANYIAPVPFIAGLLGFFIDKRLQLWRAKCKKIKNKWGDGLTCGGKIKMIWDVWDTDNIYRLEELYKSN